MCMSLNVQDDWKRVLRTLVAHAPKHVLIGVGTVMDDTVCELKEIAEIGKSLPWVTCFR